MAGMPALRGLSWRLAYAQKSETPGRAAVAEGLILLGFLAVLVAIFTVRTRRRLGLASTGKTWAVVIAVFVIFVLGMWASTRH